MPDDRRKPGLVRRYLLRRSLFRNKAWLDAYTGRGSVKKNSPKAGGTLGLLSIERHGRRASNSA